MSATQAQRRPARRWGAWLVALAGACTGLSALAAPAPAPGRELLVCADPSNLPYSNQREQGFENALARLLAQELDARLLYDWHLQRRGFLRRTLLAGRCDVVLGVPPGLPGVATTRPYYSSSYVFVTRRDAKAQPAGFDDPVLRDWRIGLQALGVEGANTPPASALARRGIVQGVVGFPMWGVAEDESPPAHLIEAVAQGRIDTAIVWGPFAGYFAKAHGDALTLQPVLSDPLQPGLAFRYDLAVAVRRGDDELLRQLQAALDRREADIRQLLQNHGVPLLPSPGPALAAPAVPTALAATSTTEPVRP